MNGETFSGAADITPHDTNNLGNGCRAIWVGTAGNVKVTTVQDDTVTFQNVPVGWLPVRAKIVWSTGTTASGLVAVW